MALLDDIGRRITGGLTYAPEDRNRDIFTDLKERAEADRKRREAEERRRREEERRRQAEVERFRKEQEAANRRADAERRKLQSEQQRRERQAPPSPVERQFERQDRAMRGTEEAVQQSQSRRAVEDFQRIERDPVQQRRGTEINYQQQRGRAEDPAAFDSMYRGRQDALAWANTPRGRDFLTAGGYAEIDHERLSTDTWGALRDNDNLREFGWGLTSPESRATLLARGVPASVLDGLATYGQQRNWEGFTSIGASQAASPGPVQGVVKDLTGNDLAAGLASGLTYAIPVVGPVLGAAEAGSRPGADSGLPLALEAGGSALDAVSLGRPGQRVASGVAGRLGGAGIAGRAANVPAQAGLNVSQDVPSMVLYLKAQGLSNDEILDVMTEGGWAAPVVISALAGAAVPSIGAAAPIARRVAPELTGAGVATGVGYAAGARDEELAALAGLGAVGGSIAARGLAQNPAVRGAIGAFHRGESGEVNAGLIGDAARALVRREGNKYTASDGTEFTGLGAKRRAEEYNVQKSYVGQQVRSYAGGLDEVREVHYDPKGHKFSYTVADATSGEIRTHSTRLDASKLVAPPAPALRSQIALEGSQRLGMTPEGVTPRIERLDEISGSTRTPVLDPAPRPQAIEGEVLDPGTALALTARDVLAPGAPPPPPPTGALPPALPPSGRDVGPARPPDGGELRDVETGFQHGDPQWFLDAADSQLSGQAPIRLARRAVTALKGKAKGVETRNILAQIANVPVRMAEFVDASARWGRGTQRAVLAQANYAEHQAGITSQLLRDAHRILGPAFQDTRGRRLGRLGATLAPPAAGLTVAATSDDETVQRIALATGVVGSLAARDLAGFALPKRPAYMQVPYFAPDRFEGINPKLRSQGGVFQHLLARPQEFDFRNHPGIEESINGIRNLIERREDNVDAVRAWAGLEPLPRRENRGAVMWFTPESVRRELGGDTATVTFTVGPNVVRRVAPEFERELGADVVEALTKYPGLELAFPDPMTLLAHDLTWKAQIEGNAIAKRALQEQGVRDRSGPIRDKIGDVIQKMTEVDDPAERAALRSEMGGLAQRLQVTEAAEHRAGRRPDWKRIPGLDDKDGGFFFPPDVVDDMRHLTEPKYDGLLGPLDQVQAEIRTLLFSLDLSAWTLQGLMAAANDPIGLIRNSPQLVGASVFGPQFADWWIRRNPEVTERASAAGLRFSREHGFQHERTVAARLPIVRQMETRGFGAWLPVMRLELFRNLSRQEALIEKVLGSKSGRVLGYGGANDATRLTLKAIEGSPLAAGAFYALSDDDAEGWERAIALAIGGAGWMGMREGLGLIGQTAYRSLDRAGQARVDARTAKLVNRTSGQLNKQQLGITGRQAQVERTLLMRSPALTRNALIMAKLALTSTGPEGAMARAYLLQLGLLMGTLLVGAKYFATGEMDSLDASDPESLLSPSNFLRLDLGEAGTITPSNPITALIRATLRSPYVEGAPAGGELDFWSPSSMGEGLRDWGAARIPDVVGLAFEGGRDLFEGDAGGAGTRLGETLVPLPAAAALQASGYGEQRGLNTDTERRLTALAPLGGMNYTPESAAGEYNRTVDETIRELFPSLAQGNVPLSRRSLNEEQQRLLDATLGQRGISDVQDRIVAERGESDPMTDPVTRYFAEIAAAKDGLVADLAAVQAGLDDGSVSRIRARSLTSEAYAAHSAATASIRQRYAETPADRPNPVYIDGEARTDLSVLAYLDRGTQPEDAALSTYYGLDEQARKPDGTLDFERLDQLQANFLARNPHGEYVRRQLDYFSGRGLTNSEGQPVDVPYLDDLAGARALTSDYWGIADEVFSRWTERSQVFRDWETVDGMNDWFARTAQEYGIADSQLRSVYRQTNPAFDRYMKELETAQRTARAKDPVLDAALTDWYGRVPVNPMAYLAGQYGDDSFDSAGFRFIEDPLPARRAFDFARFYQDRAANRDLRREARDYSGYAFSPRRG